MVTQAEHIPVHLGAMPEAVAAVMAHDPAPGEPWILNDPYAGGTHLPDLTIVTRTELGYAVTRAHHADVGGSEPGSLPPGSRTLDEEGVVIPPTRLDDATLESLVSRMRNPDERRGDLRAQLAGNRLAERRIAELCARRGARARRGGDGRASRLLRARRACGDPRAAGRSLRGRRRARDPAGPARDPRRGDDRGRLDRHRLRRNGAAVRRQPQLPARRDPLGLLLRRSLPDRTRPSGVGRRVRARHRPCARGLPRQRALTRSGRRREHGDVEPDHGRRLRRVLARRSPSRRRARER